MLQVADRGMRAIIAQRPFPDQALCEYIPIPVSFSHRAMVLDAEAIHSDTGERPFVCKEPSCRRRFSVQSNLKRHAKVHQLQAQNEGRVPSSPRRQGSAGRVGSSPTYRFVPGHPSSGRVRVGSGGRQPSVGEGWSEEGDVEGEDDLEGEDEGVDELDEDP